LKKNIYKLKNIRIWTDKLNIIIYIINIIVGSSVAVRLEAFGFVLQPDPTLLVFYFLYIFYKNKKLTRGVAPTT
jgi:hypothetical protein